MKTFGNILFVYLAITWDTGCFQQHCGGGESVPVSTNNFIVVSLLFYRLIIMSFFV